MQQLWWTRKETSSFYIDETFFKKEKKKAAEPNLVLFSCRKSRFPFVVLSPTLQLGLKALPLKISSLHVERTTCELKSQPAPETREEWSFRRKQQCWGSGFPSQSPFCGAANKSVARYFLFARLSEGHSSPLRDLFGWCASGASRAEILNSGATVAEVMKWGSLLALRIDLADEKGVFFWFFKSFWESHVRIKFKTSVHNFPRSQPRFFKRETLRATDNDDIHVLVDVSIFIVLQKLLDSGTITLDELEANKAAIVGSSNW